MEDLRNKLLEMRRTLSAAEESGAEAEETVELDQTRQGRLTRMDAIRAQAMSKATGAQRRQALRDIDAALERIEDGSFGECQACGEPISDGRLAANPAARHCIACAEAREARR